MQSARVFWLTGLSGSGKTTIASALAAKLREKAPVILLDGDALREVFSNNIAHDRESRLAASLSYGRLCHMLSEQGVDVVCATISMFDQTRAWNREHIGRYCEIYVRVPMPELERRDSKNLYSRAKKGEIQNVVGVDIPLEEPKNPDILIDNHGEITPAQALERILQHIAHKPF